MRPEDVLRRAGLPAAPAVPLSGGDMGQVWRCGDVVVKSHPSPPPGLYLAEARGLGLLRDAGVRAPSVRWAGDEGLVIDWLAPGPEDAEALGTLIAGLHAPAGASAQFDFARRGRAARGRDIRALDRHGRWPSGRGRSRPLAHGHDEEVFIGRFRLPPARGTWRDVWVEGRVRPLLDATRSRLGTLSRRVEALLASYAPPEEGPVLLHGDLWAGNVLATADGPALIDPSAWVGERAVDLAMMQLFGGFSEAMPAYEALRPIPREVREAIPYYQLYFLLVHVHFFGGSYVPGVERVVARY